MSINTHSAYTLRDSGVNRTFTQFKVAGKGWSFKVGGSQFDDIMMEKFASTFNAGGYLKGFKDGQDVRKMPRAMAKLRKNVQRVRGPFCVPTANMCLVVCIVLVHCLGEG